MSAAFEDIRVDRVKAALTDLAAVAAFESLMEQLDGAMEVAVGAERVAFEMRGEVAAAERERERLEAALGTAEYALITGGEGDRAEALSATRAVLAADSLLPADLLLARTREDEVAALAEALAESRDSLRMLRAAWNAHFKTCPSPEAVLEAPDDSMMERIREWARAPSNTASAHLPSGDASAGGRETTP